MAAQNTGHSKEPAKIGASTGDAALLHANLRLESILETTHAGTWEWNVQTGEAVFNEVWAEIVGYTLEELAPISITTSETLTHPDDLKRSGELLERHFEGKLPFFDCDSRMKHKHGHWVWVRDRGRVITRTDDGKPLMMFCIHTDITERRQAEEGLEDLLSLLDATIESTASGILVVSPEGAVLKSNRRFAELWHIPDTVLASGNDGRLIAHVLDQLADPEAFTAGVEALYAHPRAESTDQLTFQDGRVFERTSKPMLVGGEPIGRVWSFLDITERKRAEELQKVLSGILEASLASESVEALSERIHSAVNRLMDARNFFLAIYNGKTESYTFPYFADERDSGTMDLSKPIKLGQGFTDYVRRSKKPLLINKALVQDLVDRGEVEIVGSRSESWMGVPLFDGDKVMGVVVARVIPTLTPIPKRTCRF